MELSTGKKIYVNRDIIGIGPELDEVFEGYDGSVCWIGSEDRENNGYDNLTREEMVEIADIMIGRWTEFKRRVVSQ
jgi:hypothetical protein